MVVRRPRSRGRPPKGQTCYNPAPGGHPGVWTHRTGSAPDPQRAATFVLGTIFDSSGHASHRPFLRTLRVFIDDLIP